MQIAGRVELLRMWKVSHSRCPICLILAVVIDSSLPIVPSLIVAAFISSSVASVLTAVGVACRYVPNVVYSCGGMAHEGNLILPYAMSDSASAFAVVPLHNLLAAMLPNLEVAKRHAGSAAAGPIEQARDAALRAARLVKQLLVLAGRTSAGERCEVDLAALCRRVVETCRSMFDPRITIEFEGPDRLTVRGDAVQLEQALLNLLLTARDAVGELESAHGGDRMPWIRVALDALTVAPAPAPPGAARATA